MALILTFLGKGGTGRTLTAIAAAKRLASQGRRVLLAIQDPGPAPGQLLAFNPSAEPQPLEDHLEVVQFQSAVLLEQSWNQLKALEAEYLRTPFFKAVYGEELGILPGMDSALALNALREYDASDRYDVIVYDGSGGIEMLRTWGMPEILSWYIRRFRQVFQDSDLGRTLSPFVQPVASAVLNVDWSGGLVNQQTSQMNDLMAQGRQAVNDPGRVAAYLVTTADPAAIATARYLWGSAQQVGLTVGGVIASAASADAIDPSAFAPLRVTPVPAWRSGEWQPLVEALPDFDQAAQMPRPVTVEVSSRQVRLFLPGFDKRQVRLTQYGPEVTIEAGDQRRNILLPPALQGRPVTGAKFQAPYLIISF
ncbi:MAG: ArsA family ATPase [Leptolyngbyaceae cyanobacterium RM2_2_21]|nr:ArsA family ATPase [Leptolyngbyaceae cyanobacterium RM2_2_21]